MCRWTELRHCTHISGHAELCLPVSAATSAEPDTPNTAGQRAGGNPPKPSSDSKPCGDPGNKPALDPATGISTWLRDHADYRLSVLMSPTGPFTHSTDSAGWGDPLPYDLTSTGLPLLSSSGDALEE